MVSTRQYIIGRLKRYVAAMDAQKERSKKMQQLAILARTDQAEAKRQLNMLDRQPHVVDAGNYYDDLKVAIKLLEDDS